MQDFKKLDVWNKAHSLAVTVYSITKAFPSDERFGLCSQLRRACSSIGANLAEGCGRGSDADFCRHVQIAMGSACEVEHHLVLVLDLGYLEQATYQAVEAELCRVKRMLAALMKALKPPAAPRFSGRQQTADSRKPK